MEHFVENDEHTLLDYQYKCRVCLIKLEVGEAFKLNQELKSQFFTLTGFKLHSNRNYSRILCYMCQRDLCYFSYFKEKARKIQIYLSHKGEDCINGSENEEDPVIEGFPTFNLIDNQEDELPESHYDKSVAMETKKIIIHENIMIQPPNAPNAPNEPNAPNAPNAPTASIPKKQNNESDRGSKKKEKLDSSSKVTKNVSIDVKIQTTEIVEKVLKKGFPPIGSRRKSVRVLSRVKFEKPMVPQAIKYKLHSTIEPMQTRSKTISKGHNKDDLFNIIKEKPKMKDATKMHKIPITSGIFICPAPCYRIFSYRCNLLRHQRYGHSEKRPTPNIKDQIVNKSPVRPYQCQICKKYYETTTQLNNHELSVHNKKRYCKYQACSQFFYTKFNLKSHVATHFVSNTKNMCEYCGLTDEENNIKRHKLTHMVSKLHCTLCNQNFRLLKSLENHIKSIHKFSESKINKTFGGIRNRGRKNSII